MNDDIQKNVSSAKQLAEKSAQADAKVNDNKKELNPEESIRLMMEIDSNRNSIDVWTNRIKAIRKQIEEADELLHDLDKSRLEKIQQTESQYNMMLSAVYYDEVDASPGSFVEKELKYKKENLETLMDAFANEPESPWYQRYQLTQKIVSARDEIKRLEQVTEVLERQLPKRNETADTPSFPFSEEMVANAYEDNPPEPEPFFEEPSPSDEIFWQLEGAQERLDWEKLINESEQRKQKAKLKEEQDYTERLMQLASEVEGQPVGIELAAEIKIRNQQDLVRELNAKRQTIQQGLTMIQQGAVDHLENQMDSLNSLATAYDTAYYKLANATSDRLPNYESSYSLSDIVKAGEPWLHDDLPAELKKDLDFLSWEDSLPVFEAIQEVINCDKTKAAIDVDDKKHKEFHPKMLSEAQNNLEKVTKEIEKEQQLLKELLSQRERNQIDALKNRFEKQKLEIAEKVAANEQIVQMSGGASVGINAVATANVVKARLDAKRRQEEVDATSEAIGAADETNDAYSFRIEKLEKMVDADRTKRGLQPQRAVDWRSKIRRTRKGTADLSHTVAVLNDEMPSLIRRETTWSFESKHAKEALALRAGIVITDNQLDITVADRGHHEENNLRCWLDKYDMYIDLSIVVVNQGKWRIRTVLNNEATEDWPYYENNTPGVPSNPLDIKVHEGKKVTLKKYAEWHKLIMQHIRKDVEQQVAS